MAGSFTSPSGAPPKMKVGKVNRPKRTSHGGTLPSKPEYPLTDSFAVKSIPSFASRHSKTNGKSGFNCTPARPPAGRLAVHAKKPSRGSGRTV